MRTPAREHLLHALYEAAELEHNLMCTYLYAAFSLKGGEADGLTAREAEAVARWRRTILRVSTEEMAHLVMVWNLTTALGGSPRFGRSNFPLDPGNLPAAVIVRLAPFTEAVVQHFVHLERPADSHEPDGDGFTPEFAYHRAVQRPRITPTGFDYQTIGEFYLALRDNLRAFAEHHGDEIAFCGDAALQLSGAEVELIEAKPVICAKTALAALTAIVEQGEGSPAHVAGSHFHRFVAIREELAALRAANPAFQPAFPAASNPVFRPPPRPQGRVWIENEAAAQTVDLANSTYGLMLRLLAFSYLVPRPSPHKRLAVDLSLGLMRVLTPLAERAVRLPAGASSPGCNAGVSFTALRDASPFAPGPAAARFFLERLDQLAEHASTLDASDPRVAGAARILQDLRARAQRGFADDSHPVAAPAPSPKPVVKLPIAPPTPIQQGGADFIEGKDLTLIYEGKRCIHSRFCVTGAPQVFLANVKGPWIQPDAVDVARLVEIAHACPSNAIRYQRKDGGPNETAPPVNLIAIRENGPYAVRADIRLDGAAYGFRATLCRCGASKAKPFCDGSHHEIAFTATGEPATGAAEMPEVRDGPLEIDLLVDGPLAVRGNLEMISGTGRVVARVQTAKLCRCGGSGTKPYCDGTHQRIGFRSDA